MKVANVHDFGKVKGFELGYGAISRPIMNTYSYLVDGILIDTCSPNVKDAFMGLIDKESIDSVLLTHHHEDHSGNAAPLKSLKNVPVYGHEITVLKMKNSFPILPYQYYMWGKAPKVDVGLLPQSIESNSYTFIPMHTPGHSKDHVVYHVESEGWLFTGDLFLAPKIKYFRADENIKDTIESLQKIQKLEFDTIFCSINPQLKNGKSLMKRKLDYLVELYGQVEEYLNQGLCVHEIIHKLPVKELPLVKILTGGNVSLLNMVKSVIENVKNNN